jgi:hypothetical protein
MPLIMTVNTVAECPRTDCNNIYCEGKKVTALRYLLSHIETRMIARGENEKKGDELTVPLITFP